MTNDRIWQGDDGDCGLKVLDFLFKSMMIDADWSTRGERAFQWWGHQLAQRIWAEPPRNDLGEMVSLVHVETDFLRNVQDSDKTYNQLNNMQFLSSLYAFIYIPSEKKIKLHSTAYVHAGNYSWVSRLLLNASGIQLYSADRYQLLMRLFEGSEPDYTPHPVSGHRETPDGLVKDLGEYYISQGQAPIRVPRGEFANACKELANFSVLATPDETGLTAEFHFVGDDPAIARKMAGKKGVATSLFQVFVDTPHSQLGYGINSVLVLPLVDSKETGYRRCNRLNLFESEQWIRCHLLGSWRALTDEDGHADIAFCSFLPAFPCQPGLTANLALSNGLRSTWASTALNVSVKS